MNKKGKKERVQGQSRLVARLQMKEVDHQLADPTGDAKSDEAQPSWTQKTANPYARLCCYLGASTDAAPEKWFDSDR